jgi:hypothetical protein
MAGVASQAHKNTQSQAPDDATTGTDMVATIAGDTPAGDFNDIPDLEEPNEEDQFAHPSDDETCISAHTMTGTLSISDTDMPSHPCWCWCTTLKVGLNLNDNG